MTAYSASSVLAFLIGLVVSTVVIYLVSAFIGAKKGLKTAFITGYHRINHLCRCIFSAWEWDRCSNYGRNNLAICAKNRLQNRLASRFGDGHYNMDSYVYCWIDITHITRSYVIKKQR